MTTSVKENFHAYTSSEDEDGEVKEVDLEIDPEGYFNMHVGRVRVLSGELDDLIPFLKEALAQAEAAVSTIED